MRLCRPTVSPSSSSSSSSNLTTRSPPSSLLGGSPVPVLKHSLGNIHNVQAISVNNLAGADPNARTIVDFYYDILSPYSYLAFETLCRYREEWNLTLQFKPVHLGAIMAATKNSPPGLVPLKGSYMQKDLMRLSQYFDVSLKFPTKLKEVMFGSLPVQRILTAVALKYPEYLEEVSRNFWLRHWTRDQDILGREGQIAALTSANLTEPQSNEIIDLSSTNEVKNLLKTNTDEAVNFGAFGVPAIVFSIPNKLGKDGKAKKELLFGSDRFHVMAMMLNREFNGARPTPNKKKIMSRL